MIDCLTTNFTFFTRSMTTVIDDGDRELIITTIRFTVGFFVISANIFVLVMFLWARIHKKSFTYSLLLHQSVIDIIASCLFLVYFTNSAPNGVHGKIFCKTRSVFWSFMYASTYNHIIMTIGRYIAVIHPITYREKIHNKSNKRYLVIPHIVGITVACHLAVLGDTNNAGKCYFNYSSDASRVASGLFIFVISWLIPFLIIIVCYTFILKTLYYRVQPKCTEKSSHGKKYFTRNIRSITYMLLLVTIAFLFCWTPNHILYLFYTISKSFEYNSSLINEITVILNAVNLMINPIIYAFKFNDFKLAVRKFYKEYFTNVMVASRI
ncbi:kappa-type opioid receptor-like [Anneissia japonica]|uniref:kappa-type opioid receptor-like n=1 Tax=Anneissia japonica TaxID=1529436 RepID=UPI001425A9E8|nr:kappa-type opioid receptor-like [Anneissia japonica]